VTPNDASFLKRVTRLTGANLGVPPELTDAYPACRSLSSFVALEATTAELAGMASCWESARPVSF
jgi:hypothetical protein